MDSYVDERYMSICEIQIHFKFLYFTLFYINPLTPNDPYSGHTAPLTSKR